MRQRRAATATRGAVRRRAGRAGRASLAAAVVLALVGGVVAASPAIGQEADGGEVRIVARKLAGGKVEVGLQQRQADDSWGTRQLPRARFLPATAPTARWLASSPLSLPSPQDSRPVPTYEKAARALLAREVGATPGDFRLESAERVQWNDSSLGCPQPGHVYAKVIIPGYRLVFSLDGTSYRVHTNDDGSQAIICNNPR